MSAVGCVGKNGEQWRRRQPDRARCEMFVIMLEGGSLSYAKISLIFWRGFSVRVFFLIDAELGIFMDMLDRFRIMIYVDRFVFVLWACCYFDECKSNAKWNQIPFHVTLRIFQLWTPSTFSSSFFIMESHRHVRILNGIHLSNRSCIPSTYPFPQNNLTIAHARCPPTTVVFTKWYLTPFRVSQNGHLVFSTYQILRYHACGGSAPTSL